MPKMSYAEQLKHPNWQRRRLERLELAEWSCDHCGAKEKTLHVHHKRYAKGRMAWDYEDDELAVLCEPCHEAEHEAQDRMHELEVEVGADVIRALVVGYTNSIDCFAAVGPDKQAVRDAAPMAFSAGELAALVEATFVHWPGMFNAVVVMAAHALRTKGADEAFESWHMFRGSGQRLRLQIERQQRAAFDHLNAFVEAINSARDEPSEGAAG